MTCKKVDLESLPQREPIRYPPNSNGPYNIIPKRFWRFLQSRVGRKWNDIYSEIKIKFAEELKDRPTIVDFAVDFNCKKVDGIIYDSRGFEMPKYSNHGTYFYVIQDGTLECSVPTKRKSPQKNQKIHRIGKGSYFCHNGIWYEIEIEPLNLTKKRPYPTHMDFGYDVFLGRIWSAFQASNFYGEAVRCISKRQINKREKKRINVV